jgi:hypothetical protein
MTASIPTHKAHVATLNVASELTYGRITHGAEISRNLRVSRASKYVGVNVTLCGWDFRSKTVNGAVRRKVAEMMNKSGVEVAELHETANLLPCRRHWLVCNDLNFLCRNRKFYEPTQYIPNIPSP